jgi:hypothetical protein
MFEIQVEDKRMLPWRGRELVEPDSFHVVCRQGKITKCLPEKSFGEYFTMGSKKSA